jgi:predicted amidohydrolase
VAVVRVATRQFPVSSDVVANLGYILRQVRLAKDQGAHVAHFPEGALSGYAGTDFESFAGFDWERLRVATCRVLRRNTPGILVSTMDTAQAVYDSTIAWRDRAMDGILHSGTLVSD